MVRLDLTTLLLFFETIPQQKRVDVLALFNLANSLAIAGGSLLGAGILSVLGDGRTGYLALFAISSLARGVAILALVRMPVREAARWPAVVVPTPHYLQKQFSLTAARPAKSRIEHEARVGGRL